MAYLVDPRELCGTAEVAQLTGLSDTRINQLRREGKLPPPVRVVRATPLWLRSHIENWMATRVKGAPGRPPGKRKVNPA